MKLFRNDLKNGLYLMKFIAIFLLAILLNACKEEPIGQRPNDKIPPPPVTNVKAEPIAGGAVITYDLPNDNDISYVLCEYTTSSGEKKVTRSSVYQNSITVEGLVETKPTAYSLFLVDHSENKSQPFNGSFVAKEPNFKTVFETITMEPNFGGVLFKWKNENKDQLGFFLYVLNDAGKWEEKDLTFSTKVEDSRSIRGYDTKKRKFGIQIMDRFGHKTDTLILEAVPLFEKMLDKKKFIDGFLMGDNNTINGGRPLANVWDGDVNTIWHSLPTAPFFMPETFTIDLGVSALLSRMVLWNRLDYSYAQHNPRYFEVWGSNTMSHSRTDDFWKTDAWKNEWKLLGNYEEIKPSGLPYGQTTNEDKTAEAAGFEFMFEPGVGKMRYLRFVVKETWQKTNAIHFAEVSIFGDDK